MKLALPPQSICPPFITCPARLPRLPRTTMVPPRMPTPAIALACCPTMIVPESMLSPTPQPALFCTLMVGGIGQPAAEVAGAAVDLHRRALEQADAEQMPRIRVVDHDLFAVARKGAYCTIDLRDTDIVRIDIGHNVTTDCSVRLPDCLIHNYTLSVPLPSRTE